MIRVVLCDDHGVVLAGLDRLLATFDGIEVVATAADGAAAIAAVAVHRPDVVLMDLQMPNLDGLEATRRIRNRGGERVPVIAMTANAMQGDRERCMEAGMDDYVSKPITPDALRLALKRLASPSLPATPA